MNQIERTHRSRQKLLGRASIVGIVALMVGDALTPAGTDQHITTVSAGVKELQAAAAHPAQLYVAFILVILGFYGFGVGFLALASLMRERGSRPATIGASIGLFACISAAIINVWSGLDVYAALKAHLTYTQGAQFLASAQHTSAVSAVFAIGYFAGLLVAGILIGIALWRSRVAPRWTGVVFPVSLMVAAASPSGLPGTALAVPFAALMIWLSVQVVRRASDEAADTPLEAAPAHA